MLNNIPPQEVCFYIIQCQITGNFISRAPSMCRISRSHILCRKHFSLFFFPSVIQSNKKKLRQDASNRNLQAKEQLLKVFQFHWFWISQWLLLALCLRHLTLVGGEEEEVTADIGGMGLSEVSAAPPPPLQLPDLSLPKHSSLALTLADSASFLSVLLLHTNRRSRSTGWSAPLQQRWQSYQRTPQSRTSISSWWGRELCTDPGRTGSGWWWSQLLPSCWSWRAEVVWPLTPSR